MMSKIRAAITIYADFDECETRGIRLGDMMMRYSEGDISRLDIMQEAIHDLTQMYNEELAQFLGEEMTCK